MPERPASSSQLIPHCVRHSVRAAPNALRCGLSSNAAPPCFAALKARTLRQWYHTIVWHTIVYGLKVGICLSIMPVSNPLLQFGQRVQRFRKQRGISQEDLADLADLHRNYISQIECGRRNLSLLNILKIARALKLPASKLIENIR